MATFSPSGSPIPAPAPTPKRYIHDTPKEDWTNAVRQRLGTLKASAFDQAQWTTQRADLLAAGVEERDARIEYGTGQVELVATTLLDNGTSIESHNFDATKTKGFSATRVPGTPGSAPDTTVWTMLNLEKCTVDPTSDHAARIETILGEATNSNTSKKFYDDMDGSKAIKAGEELNITRCQLADDTLTVDRIGNGPRVLVFNSEGKKQKEFSKHAPSIDGKMIDTTKIKGLDETLTLNPGDVVVTIDSTSQIAEKDIKEAIQNAHGNLYVMTAKLMNKNGNVDSSGKLQQSVPNPLNLNIYIHKPSQAQDTLDASVFDSIRSATATTRSAISTVLGSPDEQSDAQKARENVKHLDPNFIPSDGQIRAGQILTEQKGKGEKPTGSQQKSWIERALRAPTKAFGWLNQKRENASNWINKKFEWKDGDGILKKIAKTTVKTAAEVVNVLIAAPVTVIPYAAAAVVNFAAIFVPKLGWTALKFLPEMATSFRQKTKDKRQKEFEEVFGLTATSTDEDVKEAYALYESLDKLGPRARSNAMRHLMAINKQVLRVQANSESGDNEAPEVIEDAEFARAQAQSQTLWGKAARIMSFIPVLNQTFTKRVAKKNSEKTGYGNHPETTTVWTFPRVAHAVSDLVQKTDAFKDRLLAIMDVDMASKKTCALSAKRLKEELRHIAGQYAVEALHTKPKDAATVDQHVALALDVAKNDCAVDRTAAMDQANKYVNCINNAERNKASQDIHDIAEELKIVGIMSSTAILQADRTELESRLNALKIKVSNFETYFNTTKDVNLDKKPELQAQFDKLKAAANAHIALAQKHPLSPEFIAFIDTDAVWGTMPSATPDVVNQAKAAIAASLIDIHKSINGGARTLYSLDPSATTDITTTKGKIETDVAGLLNNVKIELTRRGATDPDLQRYIVSLKNYYNTIINDLSAGKAVGSNLVANFEASYESIEAIDKEYKENITAKATDIVATVETKCQDALKIYYTALHNNQDPETAYKALTTTLAGLQDAEMPAMLAAPEVLALNHDITFKQQLASLIAGYGATAELVHTSRGRNWDTFDRTEHLGRALESLESTGIPQILKLLKERAVLSASKGLAQHMGIAGLGAIAVGAVCTEVGKRMVDAQVHEGVRHALLGKNLDSFKEITPLIIARGTFLGIAVPDDVKSDHHKFQKWIDKQISQVTDGFGVERIAFEIVRLVESLDPSNADQLKQIQAAAQLISNLLGEVQTNATAVKEDVGGTMSSRSAGVEVMEKLERHLRGLSFHLDRTEIERLRSERLKERQGFQVFASRVAKRGVLGGLVEVKRNPAQAARDILGKIFFMGPSLAGEAMVVHAGVSLWDQALEHVGVHHGMSSLLHIAEAPSMALGLATSTLVDQGIPLVGGTHRAHDAHGIIGTPLRGVDNVVDQVRAATSHNYPVNRTVEVASAIAHAVRHPIASAHDIGQAVRHPIDTLGRVIHGTPRQHTPATQPHTPAPTTTTPPPSTDGGTEVPGHPPVRPGTPPASPHGDGQTAPGHTPTPVTGDNDHPTAPGTTDHPAPEPSSHANNAEGFVDAGRMTAGNEGRGREGRMMAVLDARYPDLTDHERNIIANRLQNNAAVARAIRDAHQGVSHVGDQVDVRVEGDHVVVRFHRPAGHGRAESNDASTTVPLTELLRNVPAAEAAHIRSSLGLAAPTTGAPTATTSPTSGTAPTAAVAGTRTTAPTAGSRHGGHHGSHGGTASGGQGGRHAPDTGHGRTDDRHRDDTQRTGADRAPETAANRLSEPLTTSVVEYLNRYEHLDGVTVTPRAGQPGTVAITYGSPTNTLELILETRNGALSVSRGLSHEAPESLAWGDRLFNLFSARIGAIYDRQTHEARDAALTYLREHRTEGVSYGPGELPNSVQIMYREPSGTTRTIPANVTQARDGRMIIVSPYFTENSTDLIHTIQNQINDALSLRAGIRRDLTDVSNNIESDARSDLVDGLRSALHASSQEDHDEQVRDATQELRDETDREDRPELETALAEATRGLVIEPGSRQGELAVRFRDTHGVAQTLTYRIATNATGGHIIYLPATDAGNRAMVTRITRQIQMFYEESDSESVVTIPNDAQHPTSTAPRAANTPVATQPTPRATVSSVLSSLTGSQPVAPATTPAPTRVASEEPNRELSPRTGYHENPHTRLLDNRHTQSLIQRVTPAVSTEGITLAPVRGLPGRIAVTFGSPARTFNVDVYHNRTSGETVVTRDGPAFDAALQRVFQTVNSRIIASYPRPSTAQVAGSRTVANTGSGDGLPADILSGIDDDESLPEDDDTTPPPPTSSPRGPQRPTGGSGSGGSGTPRTDRGPTGSRSADVRAARTVAPTEQPRAESTTTERAEAHAPERPLVSEAELEQPASMTIRRANVEAYNSDTATNQYLRLSARAAHAGLIDIQGTGSHTTDRITVMTHPNRDGSLRVIRVRPGTANGANFSDDDAHRNAALAGRPLSEVLATLRGRIAPQSTTTPAVQEPAPGTTTASLIRGRIEAYSSARDQAPIGVVLFGGPITESVMERDFQNTAVGEWLNNVNEATRIATLRSDLMGSGYLMDQVRELAAFAHNQSTFTIEEHPWATRITEENILKAIAEEIRDGTINARDIAHNSHLNIPYAADGNTMNPDTQALLRRIVDIANYAGSSLRLNPQLAHNENSGEVVEERRERHSEVDIGDPEDKYEQGGNERMAAIIHDIADISDDDTITAPADRARMEDDEIIRTHMGGYVTEQDLRSRLDDLRRSHMNGTTFDDAAFLADLELLRDSGDRYLRSPEGRTLHVRIPEGRNSAVVLADTLENSLDDRQKMAIRYGIARAVERHQPIVRAVAGLREVGAQEAAARENGRLVTRLNDRERALVHDVDTNLPAHADLTTYTLDQLHELTNALRTRINSVNEGGSSVPVGALASLQGRVMAIAGERELLQVNAHRIAENIATRINEQAHGNRDMIVSAARIEEQLLQFSGGAAFRNFEFQGAGVGITREFQVLSDTSRHSFTVGLDCGVGMSTSNGAGAGVGVHANYSYRITRGLDFISGAAVGGTGALDLSAGAAAGIYAGFRGRISNNIDGVALLTGSVSLTTGGLSFGTVLGVQYNPAHAFEGMMHNLRQEMGLSVQPGDHDIEIQTRAVQRFGIQREENAARILGDSNEIMRRYRLLYQGATDTSLENSVHNGISGGGIGFGVINGLPVFGPYLRITLGSGMYFEARRTPDGHLHTLFHDAFQEAVQAAARNDSHTTTTHVTRMSREVTAPDVGTDHAGLARVIHGTAHLRETVLGGVNTPESRQNAINAALAGAQLHLTGNRVTINNPVESVEYRIMNFNVPGMRVEADQNGSGATLTLPADNNFTIVRVHAYGLDPSGVNQNQREVIIFCRANMTNAEIEAMAEEATLRTSDYVAIEHLPGEPARFREGRYDTRTMPAPVSTVASTSPAPDAAQQAGMPTANADRDLTDVEVGDLGALSREVAPADLELERAVYEYMIAHPTSLSAFRRNSEIGTRSEAEANADRLRAIYHVLNTRDFSGRQFTEGYEGYQMNRLLDDLTAAANLTDISRLSLAAQRQAVGRRLHISTRSFASVHPTGDATALAGLRESNVRMHRSAANLQQHIGEDALRGLTEYTPENLAPRHLELLESGSHGSIVVGRENGGFDRRQLPGGRVVVTMAEHFNLQTGQRDGTAMSDNDRAMARMLLRETYSQETAEAQSRPLFRRILSQTDRETFDNAVRMRHDIEQRILGAGRALRSHSERVAAVAGALAQDTQYQALITSDRFRDIEARRVRFANGIRDQLATGADHVNVRVEGRMYRINLQATVVRAIFVADANPNSHPNVGHCGNEIFSSRVHLSLVESAESTQGIRPPLSLEIEGGGTVEGRREAGTSFNIGAVNAVVPTETPPGHDHPNGGGDTPRHDHPSGGGDLTRDPNVNPGSRFDGTPPRTPTTTTPPPPSDSHGAAGSRF